MFNFKTKDNKFSLYGLIQTISIVGLFIAVGIIVLSSVGTFKLSSGLIQFIAIIAVICLCGLMSLVWARNLERGKAKVVSIVFLGIIAFVCILWIIAICVVMGLVRKGDTISEKELANTIRFIKIVLIISVQFICGTTIGSVITRYGKSMLVFQVIMYISNIIVDLYVSGWLLLFKIDGTDIAFNSSSGLFSFLTSNAVYPIAILALAYVSLSNSIIKRIELKRQNIRLKIMATELIKKKQNNKHKLMLNQLKIINKNLLNLRVC